MRRKKEFVYRIKWFEWLIRILSAISILILLIFVVAEGFNPFNLTSNEAVLTVFFPGGVILGLIVGFWKNRLGGYITILSFFGFYLLEILIMGILPHGAYIALFIFPGFLNLFYAIIQDRKRNIMLNSAQKSK
jgi:hypothetical protein